LKAKDVCVEASKQKRVDGFYAVRGPRAGSVRGSFGARCLSVVFDAFLLMDYNSKKPYIYSCKRVSDAEVMLQPARMNDEEMQSTSEVETKLRLPGLSNM
jgi:hypothetical protein